jgi:ketosteroid isomerase-like protein
MLGSRVGENTDIARRALDAVMRQSLEEAVRLCTPDVRLRTLFEDPEAPEIFGHDHEPLVGREGLREWFDRLDRLWAFLAVRHAEADERERGWVLLRVTARARGRGSAHEVELEIAVAIQVVDGLVARAELYMDEADALASIASG